MENGHLNYLIQNPESAYPIQLDSLIEKYPAISMLKVLKLKSIFESTGIIDQNLWDQLLIEWPDKRSLLKLKSVGFDPNKLIDFVSTISASAIDPTIETESFHITDSARNPDQIDHLGFIYEILEETPSFQETQSSIPDNMQINDQSSKTIINSEKTQPTEPDAELLLDLPHLGFIYELEADLSDLLEDKTLVSYEIEQVINVKNNDETIVEETEILTLLESIDEQVNDDFEKDASLSAYVSWLKALNQKQHLNISDYEQKKKMKKKSKKEKPDKDKNDRKDRSDTAKKLLKKSKKMEKDLVQKQDKSKKKTKKKSELSTIIEGSLKKSPAVITETYADLLAKQGYIEQSIEMFEKLSLLNPEKSTYFAAKILKLKNN